MSQTSVDASASYIFLAIRDATSLTNAVCRLAVYAYHGIGSYWWQLVEIVSRETNLPASICHIVVHEYNGSDPTELCIPFGKHKGIRVKSLPIPFLFWLAGEVSPLSQLSEPFHLKTLYPSVVDAAQWQVYILRSSWQQYDADRLVVGKYAGRKLQEVSVPYCRWIAFGGDPKLDDARQYILSITPWLAQRAQRALYWYGVSLL